MIKSIQYMREIASIMLVFAHYLLPYLDRFSGASGVDIFFVISW
jgi:peptidoglycan/LPS O-acetylase OafA/YrhL